MTDLLTPADEAELSDAVRGLHARRQTAEIVGGGTRLSLGGPVSADVRLSTARLSGITLYEPASLTVVVKAGTPLAELEAALAAENQFLPFEPADLRPLLGTTGEPTVGGMVATALAGPRRLQTGALRDSLIGVRFVTGEGDIIKNGGRVMKNVTGYDLVKLLAGSWGTLGVLTELSFKLLPRPHRTATVTLSGLSDAKAVEAMALATGSPFGVSGAAHMSVDGEPGTLIRVEGLADSVTYRANRLGELLAGFGPCEIGDDEAQNTRIWQAVRDVEPFVGQQGAVWRLVLKPTDAPAIVETIRKARPSQAMYDWAGGLVWLLTVEEDDSGASVIRNAVNATGGHAMLFRASEDTRRSVPVFNPQSPAIEAISAALRTKFDPAGVLNPGRVAS